jgi:ABC-2 type transport system permease protein
MSPRRNLALNSALTVVLLLLLAVPLNYLASSRFVRADLTSDQEFTLSDQAISIVRSLEAPVTVEVFLSADLPAQFALHTQRLKDKLAEFEAVSEVPFELRFTDPGDDDEARERARRLGVEPRETSVRSRGKVEAQITWLGLSIHYLDGTEVLPFVDQAATLEYDIAQALRTLQTGGEKKVIGFAIGHGETDMAAILQEERHPLKPVAQVLSEDYSLVGVDLATEQPEVPDSVDVLILMGSRAPLTEPALFAVDQFVMRGGALGLFPYASLPDTRSRQVQPAPVDFDPLLAPWGLSIGKELIVDRELNGVIRLPVTIRTPRGALQGEQPVSSPLVPILRDLDGEHPITRRIDTVVAPFATALDLTGAAALPDVQTTVLAASSPSSTVGATVRSLDPRSLAEPQDSERTGSWPVLVAVKGKLSSGWAGGQAPDGTGYPGLPESPEGTRLLVGTSFELPLANPGLLLGGIDWMAADEVLLGIRPRMSPPPVLEVPDKAGLLRVANVVGVPLLVALFGILRLRARRRRGRSS